MPPNEGKRRLRLTVPPDGIATCRPALRLSKILADVPADWQEPLQKLLTRAQSISLEPRVYGSLAWQTLTGLAYVTAGSDIDLLWQPRDRTRLETLLAVLQDWETGTGRRADGEIVLPDGTAVCWRELAGTGSRVLIKTPESVLLRGRCDVLDSFETSG